MKENLLYAISALFDSPDKIIKAAEKVAEKGYKKFDVNTPYPVHGMDGAMKLPPSKLGYFALVFGLTGTVAAISLMSFTSIFDYPIVIGGKPFFALPAFVPIMFELTVLSAAVATVISLITVFFKFPNNSHPLHDTDYMKNVSIDKYGLYIKADDEKFDKGEIEALFKELGAFKIEEIYYDEEEIFHEHKIFDKKFVAALVLISIFVSGGTYFTLNKLMFMTPFDWMMNQNKGKVQSASIFFEDGLSMRKPVDGTVKRGALPYQFQNKPELASKYLVNPLLPSKANLKLGEKKYNTFCSPCHGYHAEGDSRLNGQFPNPPTLHSNKVRNWTDGRIYHVIMEGQNIMPSYSAQLTREERWAIVLYIRALQRSLNAKETDLE